MVAYMSGRVQAFDVGEGSSGMAWIVVAVVLSPALATLAVLGYRDPLGVLLPLYAIAVPFGSSLSIPGVDSSFGSLSSLLGLALCASIAARFLWRHESLQTPAPAVAAWLLFLACTGATAFWSVKAGDSVSAFIALVSLVALYVCVAISTVASQVQSRLEDGLLAGGVAAAGYGVWQLATSSLPSSDFEGARFGRDLLDPNHTAASLLLALTVAVSRALGRPGRGATAAYVAMAIVLEFAVILTGSRGGLLASVAVLVVVTLVGRSKLVGLVVTATAVACLAVLVILAPPALADRLATTDSSGRTDIWRVGAYACSQHCLEGSGWGTFGEVYAESLPSVPEAQVPPRGVYYQPHNIWLLAAVETGVVGLVLMTLALVLTVREAARLPVGRRGPPLAALSGLLVTGMLLSNIEYKYFWLFLVYASVASRVAPEPQLDAPPRDAVGSVEVR